MNLKNLKFLFWLNKCHSPCFYAHRNYFLNSSHFLKNFMTGFECKYGVDNVLDNDLDALISRIGYIQDREYSSLFVGF